MAQPHGQPPQRKARSRKQPEQVRQFRSRGVDVEIRESPERVELTLDGIPIDVSLLDGEYHSHLANPFRAFETIDEVVDVLLANEGRTWTLHGHVCDERCRRGHHHDEGSHRHGGHRHGDAR